MFTAPFERIHNGEGNHFAGIQGGLGMFGYGGRLIVDPIEQVIINSAVVMLDRYRFEGLYGTQWTAYRLPIVGMILPDSQGASALFIKAVVEAFDGLARWGRPEARMCV